MTVTLTIAGEGVQVVLPNATSVPPVDEQAPADGKLGYSVRDAALVAGIGETSLRRAIYNGSVKARMNGRSHLILREDLHDFLRRLPIYEPEQ
jgi:hypothetical protein